METRPRHPAVQNLHNILKDEKLTPEARLQQTKKAIESITALQSDSVTADKINLDNVDETGSTPLLLALDLEDLACVTALLEAKANPNKADEHTQVLPLLCAINLAHQTHDTSFVKALLQAKADPNQWDAEGYSPLEFAFRRKLGKLELVTLLLEAKADPNHSHVSDTRNLLSCAIEAGDAECVKALLKAKADPNKPDDAIKPHRDEQYCPSFYNPNETRVRTPLCLAAGKWCEDDAITIALLEAKADPNQTGNGVGETPLICAAKQGNLSMVQRLLDAKVNPSHADQRGLTPLHVATFNNYVGTVKMLLAAKADINLETKERGPFVFRENEKGKTALGLAFDRYSADHLGIIEVLLQAGANVNYPDFFKYLDRQDLSSLHVFNCLKAHYFSRANKENFKNELLYIKKLEVFHQGLKLLSLKPDRSWFFSRYTLLSKDDWTHEILSHATASQGRRLAKQITQQIGGYLDYIPDLRDHFKLFRPETIDDSLRELKIKIKEKIENNELPHLQSIFKKSPQS